MTTIFHGRPTRPKLATKEQRMFRTMIRTGGEVPETLDFAGHYKVPQWGCGTDCSQFALVDSISGLVYGPFTVSGLPGKWVEDHDTARLEHVEFKRSSRLLKVNGCPNESDCGFYDYVIEDGKGLKLIRKELLSAKDHAEPLNDFEGDVLHVQRRMYDGKTDTTLVRVLCFSITERNAGLAVGEWPEKSSQA